MSVRVADRVEDWDGRSFDGGYAALQELADAGFSGVVRAAGAELYMTSGTVVGVEHGDIEDFETGSGTAYEAPVPALPLLAVMQAADAEVRAQYYTEETPIDEVEGTLSDGGFTGFLELSENVLSGDYFLVFHGGNSMAVGFVGTSDRLITDEEAYETAADEVGIYKVRQVDVEPIDIPAPSDGSGAAAAAADDETEPTTDEGDDVAAEAEESAEAAEPEESTEAAETETAAAAAEGAAESSDATSTAEADAGVTDQSSGSTAVAEAEPDDDPDEAAAAADRVAEAESGADVDERGAATGEARATSTEGEASGRPSGTQRTPSDRQSGGSQRRQDAAGGGQSTSAAAGGSRAGGGGASGGQAGDLETRSIPSLDPDMTQVPERTGGGSPAPPRTEPAGRSAAGSEPGRAGGASPEPEPVAGGRAEEASAGPAGGATGDSTELEDQLAEREAEIDRLEAELEDAQADRTDLEAELEELVAERDDLADEVDRLESELRRLEEELGAATDAERRMTPAEAIEGTNLFVDYDSKGAATLEKAHDGSESLEEVAENLQLGVHTEFDEAAVAVNGQDFDQFLRSTLHYRFAEWLVGTLLFEIRDTGHADNLRDLYDAIPQIRRVEFNGAIDVEYVEDGQEKGGRERFDVIFRHRMGDPLVVANLNDARDPATGGMMETLVTSAERVGQTADSLSSAFLVTSSFFESAALETVTEATQGGILSRDKRSSFVNLSRKQGYHLCLVAAREANFHMEVPEL